MHKPFAVTNLFSVGGMTMCILRYILRLYINEYSGAYSGEIKIETDFNMQNLNYPSFVQICNDLQDINTFFFHL